MKLTDKRFWKFEAAMALCAVVVFIVVAGIWYAVSGVSWLEMRAGAGIRLRYLLAYPAAGVLSWMFCNGNRSLPLAMWMIASMLVAGIECAWGEPRWWVVFAALHAAVAWLPIIFAVRSIRISPTAERSPAEGSPQPAQIPNGAIRRPGTLADRRFWLFEAMLLGFTAILMSANHFFDFITIALFALVYLSGGVMAWETYKGDRWYKLAGYLFLCSTLIVAVVLFGFMYDWNPATANLRPPHVPDDEGKYLTRNETVYILALAWCVLSVIPIVISSYLVKRFLKK